MPRTGKLPKRKIAPDPIYDSILVAKFINNIMEDGKKTLSQRIVYGTFNKIKNTTHRNPIEVFEEAVRMVSPKAEVRPRRVGGATYMVPMEVKSDRKQALAIKWIIKAASERSAKENLEGKLVMANKLAAEILDVVKGTGGALAQRVQVEKQAEANRAFAHFRW